MEKFSFENNFNQVTGVIRAELGDLDVRYSVLVGDIENYESTFLDCGKSFSEDFTTYRDAQNAIALVQKTLAVMDEVGEYSLDLAAVRDEILAAVADTEKNGTANTLDIIRAINKIFDYYIAHGA